MRTAHSGYFSYGDPDGDLRGTYRVWTHPTSVYGKFRVRVTVARYGGHGLNLIKNNVGTGPSRILMPSVVPMVFLIGEGVRQGEEVCREHHIERRSPISGS